MSSRRRRRRRWLAPAGATPTLDFLRRDVERAKIRLLLAEKFYSHRRNREWAQTGENWLQSVDPFLVGGSLFPIAPEIYYLAADYKLAQAEYKLSLVRLIEEREKVKETRRRTTTVANVQSCATVERFFDAMGGHRLYIDAVRPWCLRAIRRPTMPRPRFEGPPWFLCFECKKFWIENNCDNLPWHGASAVSLCSCGYYICYYCGIKTHTHRIHCKGRWIKTIKGHCRSEE